MQLPSMPAAVLAANTDVLSSLRRAHEGASAAQRRVAREQRVPRGTRRLVDDALASARQAADGVAALGAANLLDASFQRWTRHAVRELEQAAQLLARPGQLSRDGLGILQRTLFDSEVATRLGAEAGTRSLVHPSPKALERATEFVGSAGDRDGRASWVDGAWLDELGNPVRDGGMWAGPDGDRFGSDGEPVDGGWTGPDGDGFAGI